MTYRTSFVIILIGLATLGGRSMAAQTMSFFRQFTTPAFNYASAVTANASDLYVVGYTPPSDGSLARAGISKYDSRGNQLWTREVSAAGGAGAWPLDVMADSSGAYMLANPVTLGGVWMPTILRKFSPDGDELWTHTMDGFGQVALDTTGFYVSVRQGSDGAILRKYNFDRIVQWTTRLSGAGDMFSTSAITVDPTGVYVFGQSGSTHIARKFDLDGRDLWTRELNRFYYGVFTTASPSGFYLSTLDFNSGASLRKYDAAGASVWTRSIGTWNDAGSHAPADVVADGSGVYVAGGNNIWTTLPGYCRSGSAGDSFIRKYRHDGTELWTRQFGTSEASIARGVAAIQDGVFVVGQSGTGSFDLFEPPHSRITSYVARFEKDVAAVALSRPHIFPDCVVNAASYVGGGVAPGEIVTIFGSGIGPEEPVSLHLRDDARLATTLADTRILFNGVPAPLLYVSDKQSSAIVPYGAAERDSVDVQVEHSGIRSEPVTVPVLAARPGIFSVDGSGRGQATVLNEDGSFNSASNPARRGSVISIFATGGGEAAQGVADGQVVSSTVPLVTLPISVAFDLGGRKTEAEILYAGGVPLSVAGLLQINLRVPTDARPESATHFTLTIGPHWTGFQVTVALR